MESAINNLISVVKIEPDFKVVMTKSLFEPTSKVSAKVDEIWSSAVREDNNLFDGNTLCVSTSSEKELGCFGVSYRYFFAQEKDSTLKRQLNLKIAAVSGYLTIGDKVLVGKRSSAVTQCKELFELVPSGSLSYTESPNDGQIYYMKQLLSELSEEIGIDPAQVTHVEPFLLIKDEETGVYDICCKIKAEQLELPHLLQNFKPAEYTHLETFSLKQLGVIVKERPDAWVPTSVCIVHYLKNSPL